MTDDYAIANVEYRALAEFRYQVRRFLRFSEEAARHAGVEPQQYQLMLAVKGLPPGLRPRIGEVAERLQIQHHSTVELVDRLEKQGLVQRKRGSEDRREVIISLTQRGEKLLSEVATHHRNQLLNSGPQLLHSLRHVIGANVASQRPASNSQPAKASSTRPAAKRVARKRNPSR
ncbi:MAG TPA: MarR family transcriptional regulator [Clostridia bacterium]|nr:MarR family transcriptional regulator [Clostridia bacterium]